MISKIYNSNQILFKAGTRKGKLREEIALEIELQKYKPDQVYVGELRRAISWKRPKKKQLTKKQRRANFLKGKKNGL
tara:strand:+ start:275 stop:505 length:231 start_codon:yes stop_codon:yes gene_type:complete